MDKLTINLSIEEINVILHTLGQLPTSSGAYPLLTNIKAQADRQIEESKDAKSNG